MRSRSPGIGPGITFYRIGQIDQSRICCILLLESRNSPVDHRGQLLRSILLINTDFSLMSLNEVWEAASATPFHPLVSKDNQFAVGFNLLLIGEDSLLRQPQLEHH